MYSSDCTEYLIQANPIHQTVACLHKLMYRILDSGQPSTCLVKWLYWTVDSFQSFESNYIPVHTRLKSKYLTQLCHRLNSRSQIREERASRVRPTSFLRKYEQLVYQQWKKRDYGRLYTLLCRGVSYSCTVRAFTWERATDMLSSGDDETVELCQRLLLL